MTEKTDQRPNILLLHSDQHTAAIIGAYGDSLVRTPNLDRLAQSGAVIENMYCASPICVPSRASFFTGRHPYQNLVWTNSHVFNSGVPTYAHALGAAGYRPVLVGRAHFVGPDQLHGFAERYVGDHSPNYLGGTPVDHGMLQGTAGPHRVSLQRSGHGQSAYQVHDEYVAAAAVDYLDRLGVRKRAGNRVEPFALVVGFMLPHQPFVARREDYDLYRPVMTMPRTPEPYSDNLHPYFRWWRKHAGIKQVGQEEVLRARTAYWALVTRLDAMVGEVLQALERNNLARDTLIIYTSDHGDQVGEHGLWWKQTFYDYSAKVPAILSWPEGLPKGTRCSRVTSQLDLNATILDAAGAPALPTSHGRSLLPLLRDPAGTRWEDLAFSEYCTEPGDPAHSEGERTTQQRMVRQGDWKLNYYHSMEPQLFNLREDPYESYDKAGDPGCQSTRLDLTRLVLEDWDPVAVAAQIAAMSREQEVLKAWAQNTRPADQYRWDLRPEMDYLDPEQD
ncbi:MAG: sulfatase-like hydrolase/transferase [Chloroflexota bacterium]|nr:sulfatase-like hydrolase/transferase [Chloroflexota bacterium]